MKTLHVMLMAAGLITATHAANATETITYIYDAQGSVTQALAVNSSGTFSTCHYYDNAEPRRPLWHASRFISYEDDHRPLRDMYFTALRPLEDHTRELGG